MSQDYEMTLVTDPAKFPAVLARGSSANWIPEGENAPRMLLILEDKGESVRCRCGALPAFDLPKAKLAGVYLEAPIS